MAHFYFASLLTLFYFLMYQSVAELEQKWQSEVDDAMQGKLENNMPFFYDYHFNEVSKLCDLSLGIGIYSAKVCICVCVCV